MRFIRKNGRVIPIKDDVHSVGVGRGAAAGASVGAKVAIGHQLAAHYSAAKHAKAMLTKSGSALTGSPAVSALKRMGNSLRHGFGGGKIAKATAIGAAVGAAIGSIKFSKVRKGESNMQAARRIARAK